ncbi:MAG: RDD family protein [Campylobacter sp.]
MSQKIIDNLENENIQLASFGKRALAWIVDKILLSVLFYVIYSDKFQDLPYEQVVFLASELLVEIVLLDLIYQTFFTWYYGATIGKILMKIVCVDVYLFDKPNLSASFVRAAVRIVSENAFFLGFFWAFSNPLFQTWQDKAAKTVVVNAF